MSKRHFFYLIAGCVLFAFLYSPLPLYFLSDDWDSLLFSLQPSHLFHSFRPLSDASLYVDFSIWKMNASGFHITNLILHFISVFCFYFFSKKIFYLQSDRLATTKLALASSYVFLYYPFHSEALFWIVGRGAILCTMFGLLCFIFYLQKEKRVLYYSLSILCFAAALLSYEEAWIIPVIITLFAFIYKSKNLKTSVFSVAIFWFVFIAYLSGRYFFTQSFIGTPYGSERMLNFNLLLLGKNFIALLFRSVVIPMQSSVLFLVVCAIVTVMFITLLIFIRKKIKLALLVSASCFLLSLLPVVPLGIDTHDTESERFLYFPSVFFVVFLVQIFYLLSIKKVWFVYIVCIAEIVALRRSYNSFVTSSNICRTTIETLSKTGSADTLFCTHLPDQYKGAFIFRNGFESAVRLIKKDSVHQVVILSRSELFNPAINYKIELSDSLSKQKSNLYLEWKEDRIVCKKADY